MSISINIDTKTLTSESAVCHLMPCEIQHTGEANVSKYFEPAIRQNSKGEALTSSFRGRPLHGKVIQIPKGYTGVFLKEESENKDDDTVSNTNWSLVQQFSEFTYWNWDKQPSANDKIVQALSWLDIAKAIHSTDETGDS